MARHPGVNSNYNGKDIGEIWGYRTDRLYQMRILN